MINPTQPPDSVGEAKPHSGAGEALYQCEVCGFQYAEKEWVQQCEAWCQEHKSCNLEIIAHGTPPHDEQGVEGATKNEASRAISTTVFYGLIGLVSSLAFFLVLYQVLLIDSSITSLIANTLNEPVYLWSYVLLTLTAVVLFGVNASLLVYRVRKFGWPNIKSQAGSSSGSLVAVAAAACPVCGSTLLAAIGIVGGLAAFPLGGLELKALSVGLLALSIWLMSKDLKNLKTDCARGVCSLPKDHSFKPSDRPWLYGGFAAAVVLSFVSWQMLTVEPIVARTLPVDSAATANAEVVKSDRINEIAASVLPASGFQSQVSLADSMVKLAQEGVIDREKFLAIYQSRGGLPAELKDVLDQPASQPITLTQENASYYVNLLWALGLANYMESNKDSPMKKGNKLFNFASTGGWTLGRAKNGGEYFNKFKIVELTPEQEALVTKIAQNTYRPCCNNSTFFQDCNHGSALLGLLQLGASQGLSEEDLYREALAFNSFWFPSNYIPTAFYFAEVEGIAWADVDPKVVMSKDYSSISGWGANVDKELRTRGLLPKSDDGASCGV